MGRGRDLDGGAWVRHREWRGDNEEARWRKHGKTEVEQGSIARGVAAWCCSSELQLTVDGWGGGYCSGRAPAREREMCEGERKNERRGGGTEGEGTGSAWQWWFQSPA